MTKADLIDAVAKVTGATKAQTQETIDALLEVIKTNISKEEGIRITGFGTFSVSDRNARVGRNPQTGAEIQIPAHRVPAFRPGKELKDAVNG